MGVDDSSADIIVGHIFCVLLIWKAVMAIAIFKKNCIDKSEKNAITYGNRFHSSTVMPSFRQRKKNFLIGFL